MACRRHRITRRFWKAIHPAGSWVPFSRCRDGDPRQRPHYYTQVSGCISWTNRLPCRGSVPPKERRASCRRRKPAAQPPCHPFVWQYSTASLGLSRLRRRFFDGGKMHAAPWGAHDRASARGGLPSHNDLCVRTRAAPWAMLSRAVGAPEACVRIVLRARPG